MNILQIYVVHAVTYSVPLESTENRAPGNSSRACEYAVKSMHECP